MLKVKNGDLDKLGLLYERHKKRLFGFFYNLGNAPSESEDMVQNVFMRILKYRKSYTGEGLFAAWMFRMARNVNYDHHGRSSKNRSVEMVDPDTVRLEREEGDDHLDKKENTQQLNRALSLLPTEKREVLVLSKLRELKFRELAEILGCSEGAAKVRVHRALNDLRKIYIQLETV